MKRKQYEKNKIGIRAGRPHEIWHADVTVLKTIDNLKAYIYFVMDNFSRYILSFRVALELSGSIMKENLLEAYNNFVFPGEHVDPQVQLITDGGPENDNKVVDDCIKQELVSLKQLIAGKDIKCSNSMVEAVNKTMKYQYLFQHDFQNADAVRNYLQQAVPDYNTRKPHGSLKGLTPQQRLLGRQLDLEKMNADMQRAREKRIEVNRLASCGICR